MALAWVHSSWFVSFAPKFWKLLVCPQHATLTVIMQVSSSLLPLNFHMYLTSGSIITLDSSTQGEHHMRRWLPPRASKLILISLRLTDAVRAPSSS
eukprot:4630896-Pleurochrysis_carterae.AAC.1